MTDKMPPPDRLTVIMGEKGVRLWNFEPGIDPLRYPDDVQYEYARLSPTTAPDVSEERAREAMFALSDRLRADGFLERRDHHAVYERAVAAFNAAFAAQPATVGETWASIAAWAEETFGPGSPERIAVRAREEISELIDETEIAPDWSDKAREEAADVLICLSRVPDIWEAVERKMAINRAREWTIMGDGTGYHVRPGNEPPATRPEPVAAPDPRKIQGAIDNLLNWTEHQALCPTFSEPRAKCECGLTEAIAAVEALRVEQTEPVAAQGEEQRPHVMPGDPDNLGQIALQWYLNFQFGHPHTSRESNIAVEGFKDGYRAALRTASPMVGEEQARECQAVWRCAYGDVTVALDLLRNKWLNSKRKGDREAGAILSRVCDLIWANRGPAPSNYSEANASGSKLIERVKQTLAPSSSVGEEKRP